MASCKEFQLIEKLNQSNYANWRFKMEMLLIKEELFDVVTTDPPNPITAEWTKRDNKARALINLVISDSQIIYVKNLTSSRETWNALKQIHERTNLSSKLYLLRKLYSIKLEEKGNMHTHITTILETVDKLKAIGEEIKDSHIAALFLCSLPPSYETLITALEARPETELTPDFISSKLKDEFNRRRENREPPENATKAFHTNKKFNDYNNRNHNQYNYKKDKYCTYCRMSNHSTSECGHLKRKANNPSKYNKNYGYKQKQNNTSSLCFETKEKSEENKLDCATTSHAKNLAFLTNYTEGYKWIVDSGSSAHITNDKSLYTQIKTPEKTEVMIANGKTLTSYCQGDINMKSQTLNGEPKNITLKDVLFVPDLQTNLLSVRKAAQGGCKVIFEKEKCDITYDGNLILQAKLDDNLYTVNFEKSKDINYVNLAHQCKNANCIDLWHRRTGHRNYATIKELTFKELAVGIKIDKCSHDNICQTCIRSKLTDTPYPNKAQNRATKILQLVHTDILGPIQVPSIGGKTYILTLIDDFSRYTTVYLLSRKNEVLEKLKEFIALTSNKFGKKPGAIRSDNGGEYVNREMQ